MQMLVLGLIFMIVAAMSDALYALLSSSLGARLRSGALFARRQKLFSSGVYIALGISAALSGNRSHS
jgi:threonine/homoserine/homoserine lactone efflux protein